MNKKIKNILCVAIFASLTAVFSLISIPLPFTPVPINLAIISVFLSGGLLGFKWGSISQLIYVILRIIGIPIFSGILGGIGLIYSPTGGYVISYIICAGTIGLIIEKSKPKIFIYFLSMLVGLIICYILGTLWFIIITKSNLINALILCISPFIIGDILKIIITTSLLWKLKPLVNKLLSLKCILR